MRIPEGAIIAVEPLTRPTHTGLAQHAVQTVFDVAEERGLGMRLAQLLEMAGESVEALRAHSGDRAVAVAINFALHAEGAACTAGPAHARARSAPHAGDEQASNDRKG